MSVGQKIEVGIAVAEPRTRLEFERLVLEQRDQILRSLRFALNVGIIVKIVDIGDPRGVAEEVVDRQPVATRITREHRAQRRLEVSLPCSASSITAAAVNGFDTDAIWNIVDGRLATRCSRLASP